MAMSEIDSKKLLGLLGLANRAGKLALGFSAVEKMVRHQQRPLVILARDIGPSQKSKVERWEPVTGFIHDALSGEEMAAAFGREKLAMVAVSEAGFIKGIEKLMA